MVFVPYGGHFLSNVTVQFSDVRSWTDNRVYGIWGLCTALRRIGWPLSVYVCMVPVCVHSVIWLVAVTIFWVEVVAACGAGGRMCGWGELLSLG